MSLLVCVLKDWAYPNIVQQTPSFSSTWNGVRFVFEPVSECDLLIASNPPVSDIRIRCPEGNKWLFTGESPIEQYRWQTESFPLFDKVFTFWSSSVSPNIVHEQTSLPWHVEKSYDQLSALTAQVAALSKRPEVSWVTSNASHKEGHVLRMAFKDCLKANGFKFDLYGRGFEPIKDKFDGIYPYQYSLAIENYGCNDYWTEKIADCFLSWTVPIYWGAKNISQYFPENSFIQIDPSHPQEALKTIRAAIDDDFYSKNIDALAEARSLVLNKYQFFPHVCELIDRYGVKEGRPKPKTFIPSNTWHSGPVTFYSSFKKNIKKMLLR